MGGTGKRIGLGVATGGLSEFTRINKGDAFGMDLLQKGLGFGGKSQGTFLDANAGGSPVQILAQTGGAPLLANIALGADVNEALAGYLGASRAELDHALDSGEPYLGNRLLSADEISALKSVRSQLTTIQSNKQMRDKAVQQVVNDFPQVAQFAAQERMKSGEEFDTETKKYMQLALDQTSAKYAAGGQLSSGAANEAFSRVGAEHAMDKLGYMGDREQFAYGTKMNEMNARLTEVNALRDFQNTMLGQTSNQGFSAQQAALQRQFQGQMFNAEQANQQSLMEQQSKNAMFGALGQLGGTALGGYFMGKGLGNTVNAANGFGGGGYGAGPGIDTSQYAPWGAGYSGPRLNIRR